MCIIIYLHEGFYNDDLKFSLIVVVRFLLTEVNNNIILDTNYL